MKRFTAFALCALLCLAPVTLNTGCATGKGQLNPTTGVYDPNAVADVLVVTVENVREITLDTMDNLMRIERQNQAALMKINPQIHVFAEHVRRDGRQLLNALTQAKVAYQNSRSAEDATKLKNALASVQSLLRDSLRYLAEIASRKQ